MKPYFKSSPDTPRISRRGGALSSRLRTLGLVLLAGALLGGQRLLQRRQ